MVNANPNWPLLATEVDFTQGPPQPPGSARRSINAPYRRLVVRTIESHRGRQYEMDQVQTGQLTLTVVDPLEQLHPENAVSPFNAGANKIKAYRGVWVWAMWPNQPGSGNINNTAVSTTYDPDFERGTTGGWAAQDGTATVTNTTSVAYSGTHSLAVTQTTAGAGHGVSALFRTCPRITYTVSMRVRPAAGVTVGLRVLRADGSVVVGTSTTTPEVWQQVSVTWDAVDTLEPVELYASGGGLAFNVDEAQLEFGTAVTAFTTSGPGLYPIYTGFVERFPVNYDMFGTRRIVPVTGVDALGVLSRTEITQSYSDTIAADTPVLHFPWTDEVGPGRPDIGGKQFAVTIGLGTNGEVSWQGDTWLDGSSVLSVTKQNATDPPTDGYFAKEQWTEWNTTTGFVQFNPHAATIECWVRFSEGVIVPMQLASVTNGTTVRANETYVRFEVDAGRLMVVIRDAISGTTGQFGFPLASGWDGFPDGKWHYIAVTLFTFGDGNSGIGVMCDGVEDLFVLSTPPSTTWPINNLHFSADTEFGDLRSQMAIAHWAVYPRNIGNSKRKAHWQRGIGFAGELSGARVSRLLTTYWGGPKLVAAGTLKMAEDFSYDGRYMLDALQEIQASEQGLVYADRSGAVVFEDRLTRYATQSPVGELGEDASAGEAPYVDFKADFDPTYTFSAAKVTRPGNQTPLIVSNAQAQTDYGQRILTQTVQCTTDFDLQQAGVFYTTRYADQRVRISSLTLNPAANPALWPLVLNLELSQRFTVHRRSPALITEHDYYVEQITHQINAESGQWIVALQLSPVFVPSAWVLGTSVLGVDTVPVY